MAETVIPVLCTVPVVVPESAPDAPVFKRCGKRGAWKWEYEGDARVFCREHAEKYQKPPWIDLVTHGRAVLVEL